MSTLVDCGMELATYWHTAMNHIYQLGKLSVLISKIVYCFGKISPLEVSPIEEGVHN